MNRTGKEVYQMLGGDWAFACCGIISDGFATKKEAELAAEVERLRAALDEAIHTIRIWHGMGEPKEQEEFLWKVYSEQSPEMKRIMSARKDTP